MIQTKEERRAQKKLYDATHRASARERERKYRAEHKEEVKNKKKRYYSVHGDHVRTYARKYRDIHKEKINKSKRDYRALHPEEFHAHYLKNREKLLARAKRYWWDHQEECKQKSRKRYHDNLDVRRWYARMYQRSHRTRMMKYDRKWRNTNKEKVTRKDRDKTQKLRAQVLDHYGHSCKCCGESIDRFLTVDHIANNGAEHRKMLRKQYNGRTIYRWLIENRFPKGFQILCYNCNCGRALNSGTCPHKDRSKK